MTFWEHLEELRRTLLGMLIAISLGMAITLYFYQPLLHLLGAPLNGVTNTQQLDREHIQNIRNSSNHQIEISFRENEGSVERTVVIPAGGEIEVSLQTEKRHKPLVLLSPLEGIMATFKVCFWTGLVISSPVWLWFILGFIAPALTQSGKQLLIPFLALSLLFLFAGFFFAYFVTLPMANSYLYNFNLDIGNNTWSFAQYFDYTILMLLANGLAAELSLILFLLVHYGIVSAETLISKRRHAVVGAFVLGALLTPPDILTQFMLAIPLLCFYELSIWYARFRRSGITSQ